MQFIVIRSQDLDSPALREEYVAGLPKMTEEQCLVIATLLNQFCNDYFYSVVHERYSLVQYS